MDTTYTITVFSENNPGLLNRITSIFNRRKMNLESVTTSRSEVIGVHRYNFVVYSRQLLVEKVVAQINKQVEVIRTYWSLDYEIIHRELALIKVLNRPGIEEGILSLANRYQAKLLRKEKEYFVIELSAVESQIDSLFYELEPYGICEFTRSGRIAVNQNMDHLNDYLLSLDSEIKTA
ncbi:MAG: acetolactate synthase small subunit [Cytophagales bacterium]|nr:acetolactate synthase small subunit [Cytophagales bacterium]